MDSDNLLLLPSLSPNMSTTGGGERVGRGSRTVLSWEDLAPLSCSSIHPSCSRASKSSLTSLQGGFQIICFLGDPLASRSRVVPIAGGGGHVGKHPEQSGRWRGLRLHTPWWGCLELSASVPGAACGLHGPVNYTKVGTANWAQDSWDFGGWAFAATMILRPH